MMGHPELAKDLARIGSASSRRLWRCALDPSGLKSFRMTLVYVDSSKLTHCQKNNPQSAQRFRKGRQEKGMANVFLCSLCGKLFASTAK
jgi:hypothetical protein